MFPFKSKIPVVQNVIFDKEGDTITIHHSSGRFEFDRKEIIEIRSQSDFYSPVKSEKFRAYDDLKFWDCLGLKYYLRWLYFGILGGDLNIAIANHLETCYTYYYDGWCYFGDIGLKIFVILFLILLSLLLIVFVIPAYFCKLFILKHKIHLLVDDIWEINLKNSIIKLRYNAFEGSSTEFHSQDKRNCTRFYVEEVHQRKTSLKNEKMKSFRVLKRITFLGGLLFFLYLMRDTPCWFDIQRTRISTVKEDGKSSFRKQRVTYGTYYGIPTRNSNDTKYVLPRKPSTLKLFIDGVYSNIFFSIGIFFLATIFISVLLYTFFYGYLMFFLIWTLFKNKLKLKLHPILQLFIFLFCFFISLGLCLSFEVDRTSMISFIIIWIHMLAPPIVIVIVWVFRLKENFFNFVDNNLLREGDETSVALDILIGLKRYFFWK